MIFYNGFCIPPYLSSNGSIFNICYLKGRSNLYIYVLDYRFFGSIIQRFFIIYFKGALYEVFIS